MQGQRVDDTADVFDGGTVDHLDMDRLGIESDVSGIGVIAVCPLMARMAPVYASQPKQLGKGNGASVWSARSDASTISTTETGHPRARRRNCTDRRASPSCRGDDGRAAHDHRARSVRAEAVRQKAGGAVKDTSNTVHGNFESPAIRSDTVSRPWPAAEEPT